MSTKSHTYMQHASPQPALSGNIAGLVTFRMFQKLMAKRKRTVDDLVDLFRGKIDDSRSFFERALSCTRRNPDNHRLEDNGGVVIPFKSVIKYYYEEAHFQAVTEGQK